MIVSLLVLVSLCSLAQDIGVVEVVLQQDLG